MKLTTICKALILITLSIFMGCSSGETEQKGRASDKTADPTTERSSDNVKAHTRFSGVGSVKSINKEKGEIEIDASYVPGFAPGSMKFENIDRELLNDVKPGDDVDFTFDRNGSILKLVEIKKS